MRRHLRTHGAPRAPAVQRPLPPPRAPPPREINLAALLTAAMG
jgi:hypothetical protein